ncbi:MAG: GntR family transcriptional regulator [Ilumatobacteraceae bacterium]
MTAPVVPPQKRSAAVADSLRERLERGEWAPSEKLPSEHELAAEYGVSRPTVRTALRTLDSRGLTFTIHGLGTFATAMSSVVAADLHRLESISRTIERMGRRPGMRFRSISLREASQHEAAALSVDPGSVVLALEREVLADDEVVAYARDAVPRSVFDEGFELQSIDGSLFALLERHGVVVRSAFVTVHASDGHDIGWFEEPSHPLFVLLEQLHFDDRNRGVAFSRTWFVEGRFQFSLLRVT